MLSGALGTNWQRRRRVCSLRGCQAQTAATKSGRWSGCGRKPALFKQKGPAWQLQGSTPPCRALPPACPQTRQKPQGSMDPPTRFLGVHKLQAKKLGTFKPNQSSPQPLPAPQHFDYKAGSLGAHGLLKTGFLTCTGGDSGRSHRAVHLAQEFTLPCSTSRSTFRNGLPRQPWRALKNSTVWAHPQVLTSLV